MLKCQITSSAVYKTMMRPVQLMCEAVVWTVVTQKEEGLLEKAEMLWWIVEVSLMIRAERSDQRKRLNAGRERNNL